MAIARARWLWRWLVFGPVALPAYRSVGLPGAFERVSRDVDSGYVTISGMVMDSLHGRPLRGAQVHVVNGERTAMTDEGGRFRIDSVVPGSYRLRVTHPILELLDLDLATSVDVSSGGRDSLRLSIPSGRSLLTKLCGDTGSPVAAIVGRVEDAETGEVVPRARVVAGWRALGVTARGLRLQRQAVMDSSGADGRYRLCRLPGQIEARVVAGSGDQRSGMIPFSTVASPVVVRRLRIGQAEQVAKADSGAIPADSLEPRGPVFAGSAAVSGKVVSNTGQPVPGVVVGVRGTVRTVATDSSGGFSLRGLPAGTHVLAVRLIGYTPLDSVVELSARSPVEIDVVLPARLPSLERVNVEADIDTALTITGFYRRQRERSGHFVRAKQIEKSTIDKFSDLFSKFSISTVRVSYDRRGNAVFRDARGSPNACVNIYLDHTFQRFLRPGDLDLMVDPEDVAGLEVYSRSGTPPEFVPPYIPGQGPTDCATVVIWTKFGVHER
jgi:hypothetical protein